MKFYYKDQLIRTSKTHAYNWAILTERPDGTYACHGCRVNRSDADSEASRVVWYWSFIGSLDMARQLGLITEERCQELYEKAKEMKP